MKTLRRHSKKIFIEIKSIAPRFRNRIFRAFIYPVAITFLKSKATQLQPQTTNKNASVEIHSLVCKKDINTYLLGIHSFLQYYNKYKICIHNDGSLDAKDIKLLQRKVVNAFIFSPKENIKAINKKIEKLSSLKEKYTTNILLKKLVDFKLLSTSGKIIAFDSDLLFFKEPTEIIQWTKNQEEKAVLLSEERGIDSHQDRVLSQLDYAYIHHLNSGLICYYTDYVSLDLANAAYKLKEFDTSFRPNGIGDQQFLALNFGEMQKYKKFIVKRLPFNAYVHTRELEGDDVIMKHYWSAKSSFASLQKYMKDLNTIYKHLNKHP